MLTQSERSLLDLVRDGRVDAEIAVRLGIENRLVKARLATLMARAGVATRAELREWVEPEDEPLPAVEAPVEITPKPASRRRLPASAFASIAVAVGGAAMALGWLALGDNDVAPDSARPTAEVGANAALTVAGSPPPGPTPIVTIGGLTAREAKFGGVASLPEGVEVTVVRGSALDRGVRVERITETAGVVDVATIFVARDGTRIADALADEEGDMVAVAVCSGCSGLVAGRNGARVEYFVARGRNSAFALEAERDLAAGEAVPRVAAILPAGLALQAGPTVAPVFEATSGDLCDQPPIAVAPRMGVVPAFALRLLANCNGLLLFGESVVPGFEVTASRLLADDYTIASWTDLRSRGRYYFAGVIDSLDAADSTILQLPDITQLAGRTNSGLAIGHMRTDPDTAVVTPVLLDFALGTYAFFSGPLYAVPPSSRLIEVSMIDRPPETIQVIAMRDSNQ